MVKLIDVAREAGVSPATVSRVLNDSVLVTEEKRQLVLAAVEKLGYVPLRPLAADRAERSENSVRVQPEDKPGLIVTVHGQINSLQQDGILWTARKLGYQVISAPITEDRVVDAAHLTQLLQTLQADKLLAGVLLCSHVLSPDDALLQQLRSCPVVQLGNHLPLENSAVASVEDQQVTYEAVKYLAGCGKTRPALFVRSLQPAAPAYEQRRVWGYRLAMMEQGPDPSQMLIREVDDTLEGGTEAVNALLQAGYQPDAILCSSDVTAIGCVKALCEHGRQVPDQVAVLGLEDSGAGLYATPELSTVAAPQFKAGEAAVQLLHRLITGTVEPNYIATLPHQMIIRGTSQELPGQPVHRWQENRWVDTPML